MLLACTVAEGSVGQNGDGVGVIVARAFVPRGNARQRAQTIYGIPYKGIWLASVRSMVMNGAAARFPQKDQDDYLEIREPNGSSGAPTLAEAFPESRVVLLVRDALDSAMPGGWREGRETSDAPDAIVRRSAQTYLRNVGAAKH